MNLLSKTICFFVLLFCSGQAAFSQGIDSALFFLNNPAHVNCLKCRFQDTAIFFLNQQDFESAATVLEKSLEIRDDTDWFTPLSLGQCNWHLKKYDKVENHLNIGLQVLEKKGDTNNYNYVLPLFMLGNYHFLYKQDLPKAKEIYKRVITLRERNKLINDPENFLCKNFLGDIYLKLHYIDSATTIYNDIEQKFSQVNFDDRANIYYVPYILPTLESLADLNTELRKFDAAKSYLIKAISIIKKTIGTRSEQYFDAEIKLGFLFSSFDKLDDAERILTECANDLKYQFGEQDRKYLSIQNDISLCYMKKGEYEKAKATLSKALYLQKKYLGENDDDYLLGQKIFIQLDSLINDYNYEFSVGWEMQTKFKYDSAIYHYNRALQNMTTSAKNDSDRKFGMSKVDILIDIGNCLQSLKRIDSAKAIFSQVLEIEKERITVNPKSYYFFILGEFYELCYAGKEFEQLLNLYKRELEFTKKELGENNELFLAILLNYIDCRFTSGIEDNEELLKEAAMISKKISGSKTNIHERFFTTHSVASLYEKLGAHYKNYRNYRVADSLYDKAISIYENEHLDTGFEYIDCIANKAELSQNVGNYKKAEDLYMSAYRLTKSKGDIRSSSENFSSLVKVLLGLIDLFDETGDHDRSKNYINEMASVFSSAPEYQNNIYYPIYLQKLSWMYYADGKIDSAEQILFSAIKIVDTLFREEEPNMLFNLSELFFRSYKMDSAEKYAIEALRIEKDIHPNKSMQYARILNHLSIIYSRKGMFRESLSMSLEAVEIKNRYKGANTFEHAFEYVTIGYDYIVLHNYDSAYIYFQRVLEIQSAIYNNNFKSLNYKEQLNYSKKYQSDYRTVKDLCFAFLIDTSTTHYIDRSKYINLLYLNELNYRNLAIRKDEQHAITIKTVKDELKGDDVVIELVDYNSHDTISFGSLVLSKSSHNLEFLFNFWTERTFQDSLLSQTMYTTQDGFNHLNYYFISNKLAPICSGKKNIFISPSNLLYRINFAAIPFDSTTTFGEKYNIHILNSTSDIVNYKPIYLNREAIKQVVIFGDIDYDNSIRMLGVKETQEEVNSHQFVAEIANRGAISKFGYLPGTKEESENIKRLCSNNNIASISYAGENATEASFKKLSGKKEPFVIHIATHGYFFPDPEQKKSQVPLKEFSDERKNIFKISDDPLLRSGLIFAGANHTWGKTDYTSNDTEDGILTSYEISNLDLSNCQLVVLSACETGLGDINGSEGVFGLQRAFKMAGVKNIIMSLWKVPDKETQELMTLFYNYCFSGKSVHDALQAAQSEMRKKYPPYYWAGFKLLE